MDKFKYNPIDGFKNVASYPNPANGDEARQQLFSLHEQTQIFINLLTETLNGVSGAEEIGLEITDDDRFSGMNNVGTIFKEFLAIFDANKKVWDDKYTKQEVDQKITDQVIEVGAGDMAKAIYDIDNDGKIDADKVTADSELSLSSQNPISNQAVTEYLKRYARKILTDITIPTSSFVSNTDDYAAYYPYCADIVIDGMTATCQADVVPHPATIEAGSLAGQVNTMDGSLRIYATETPTADVVIVNVSWWEVG